MKSRLVSVLALSLAVAASGAQAGGPVVVEEEAVEAQPTSSVGILPIILITVALCAALCGGSDNTQRR